MLQPHLMLLDEPFAGVHPMLKERMLERIAAPLSSPGSYQQGKELLLGMQWAVDDMNDAGGLLGKRVELVIEDTQGKPPAGATAVEKLITRDKVVGVAGEYHSSVCNAEIEVFHRYGIPFVIGSCWFDGLTAKGYPEVFRTSVYNTKQAENIVGLINQEQIKTVAALVEDTDYGIGIAENIKTVMRLTNSEATFSSEVVDKTSKDFVPVLLKYKTRLKPDLLITAVTQPGGFLVLKQAHEVGFAPSADTMVLDATCTSQNAEIFWAALKQAGQYIMMACPYSSSVRVTDLGDAVKARYVKQFDRQPNYLPLQGYDAMYTLGMAIKPDCLPWRFPCCFRPTGCASGPRRCTTSCWPRRGICCLAIAASCRLRTLPLPASAPTRPGCSTDTPA